MIYFCILLSIHIVLTGGGISTRVKELDIDAALDRYITVVLTDLNVYRDELVLLGTYGGVISVNADSLTVKDSLFDTFNISHVYSTVDDESGVIALCTNRRSRCQYMDVNTLSVLGYGDGLILEGEQGEAVDEGVLLLLANTNTNVPSLFTASGNSVTIGQIPEYPVYPIITAQLHGQLAVDAKLLAVSQMQSFNRKYISAFKSDGFVYIVTQDSGNIRVTRICESDSLLNTRFHSLYQIIIVPCVGGGFTFNVLDARLVNLSTGTEQEYILIAYEDLYRISVCAYTLNSINQAMRDTYESCVVNELGSVPNENLFDSTSGLQCSLYSDPSINTECNLWVIVGESPTNSIFLDSGSVTGGTEITTINRYTIKTAVVTTRIEDSGYCYYYLYLFQDNIITKYLMDGLSLVLPQLETLTFSGDFTAIKTDQSGSRLFAISHSELFVIPVIDCERHSSCADCVSDRDPMCGWCSVQRVCSVRSHCENYNLAYRWIDENNSQCFDVYELFPIASYFNISTNITIIASNLPELSANESYDCVFNSIVANYRTEVTSVNGDRNNIKGPTNGAVNLTCQVPTWMSSFTKSDSLVYNLSVGTNRFNSTLSSILSFTIIHCEFNTDCYSCIHSDAPCGWCLYDSLCVSQSDMCFMEEWVQPTESTVVCPKINSYFNSSSVQVPALEGSNITLQGSYLPPPILAFNYACVLNLSRIIHVVGIWENISGSNVQICCLISEDSLLMEGVSTLQLIWGPTQRYIKQGILNFGVYICGNQLDCQICLTNKDCKWCGTFDNRTGVCASMCSNDMNTFTSVQTCPPPGITDFAPRSTVIGGVVVLEVYGFNLVVEGRETLISVGETACIISLANQTQLTCSLQAPNHILTSKINLTVDEVSVESDFNFDTRITIITRVFPNFTPQSGGSNVTLFGNNLLIGSNRKITAGDSQLIILKTLNNNTIGDEILCVSEQSIYFSSPLISITIDTVQTSFTQEAFDVLADPQVTDIYLAGYEKQLRNTIVSGVLDYSLRGRNLGATLSQTLVFMLGDTEISRSDCAPPLDETSTELLCPGEYFTNIYPSPEGTDVRFELIMDSVPNVTNLFFKVFEFKIYPDPVLTKGSINNTIMIENDATEILIQIPYVDIIPSEAIWIRGILRDNNTDESICSSSRFTNLGIVCSINSSHIDQIMVLEVEIGLNDNRYILKLDVLIFAASRTGMASLILLVIIFGLILLATTCVISIVTCVCCYGLLKNRRTNKMVKYLLLEMNTVEKDLVNNWVKGFTEMNAEDEVDDDLFKVGNVPLHNFKTFVMRTLFSGLQDHAVLHPIEKPDNPDIKAFNTGLHEFEQLLHDKRFLLAMIHSMEDIPNFSNTDIRNVASTLTIALFNSMPYLTEILFDLLRELINKTVSKKSPKLLCRGTPSVAERLLTGWLAFNLYSHLQCSPSVSIYELFLRLNRHIMSKPVDIVNGKSTNALSEEKLLLEEIPYTKLDIEIEATKNNKIPCTLLDCDTITQAKIKIMDKLYQGIGFYQRPKLEDVDLMLRLEGRGRQLLRDNDMTNEEVGEWRKINTLSHYNIRSGMLLVVVPRKPKPNLGQVWDYPGTAIYDFRDAQSASQLLTLYDTQMNKVYHLQLSEQSEDKMKLKNRAIRKRNLRTEVFLPRLLATKAALQKYVDQLMEEIFPNTSVHLLFDEANQIPRAIKLLFDFFDEQRIVYSIEDPDVVHIWKSNSVTLMFWVNILKNPDFLLDVAKGATLDAALSVIAQAVIDSCSPEQYITKDSPTNKLLYYKQVQIYKTRVYKCYEEIRHAPKVHMNSITFPVNVIQARGQDCMFHVDSAVYGLFSYAQSYQEEIRNRLDIENLELQKEIFNEVCLAMT